MFYVKFLGLRRFITDENVYGTCPGCGKECRVNLQELLQAGDCDLFGTAVYCPTCSGRIQRERIEGRTGGAEG